VCVLVDPHLHTSGVTSRLVHSRVRVTCPLRQPQLGAPLDLNARLFLLEMHGKSKGDVCLFFPGHGARGAKQLVLDTFLSGVTMSRGPEDKIAKTKRSNMKTK